MKDIELVREPRTMTFSFTGKDSHSVTIQPEQGSFSIGTKEDTEEEWDALVDADDIIHWETFNGYYISRFQGKRNLEYEKEYPYGDWPRFFFYSGNDTGFIEWSSKRWVEDFAWKPKKDVVVDFKKANIGRLYLYSTDRKIEFSLGKGVEYLELHGKLENYKIDRCDSIIPLVFVPKYKESVEVYQLPIYEAFREVTEVRIYSSPLDPPFDCATLLQFPKIEQLFLIGNMKNLDALKGLKHIVKLGIWDMPNLSDMPELNVWHNLRELIAINIEKEGGKRLREEAQKLKKEGFQLDVFIQKFRESSWFEINYGIPFSLWKEENEKRAVRAYKMCLKRIKKASIEKEVQNAIIKFTESMNELKDIETNERDDVYQALCIIMKHSLIQVPSEKWVQWFDETRNF